MTPRPRVPGVSDVNFEQNDVLLAGYCTGEVELTRSGRSAAVWAMPSGRPDLVNRYADGVFLGILQNGFSKIVGFPALQKERATQADISAVADYGWITRPGVVLLQLDQRLQHLRDVRLRSADRRQVLLAQNTALATLTGFELYGDYEADDITTLFASMHVRRRRRPRHQPPAAADLSAARPPGHSLGRPTAGQHLGPGVGLPLRRAGRTAFGFLRDTHRQRTDEHRGRDARRRGFVTSYVRGYYNLTEQLHFVGGIDNLFDRTIWSISTCGCKAPRSTPGGVTAALSPGFTAYVGLEWLL